MIGLLLITHCNHGESLIQCAAHVYGNRPVQIAQLGFSSGDNPQEVLARATELLKSVNTGEGVLIMTDMIGATPANIAAKLLIPGQIEGLAGLSLPMLLRAMTYRDKGMATLLERAAAGGRDGVLNMH